MLDVNLCRMSFIATQLMYGNLSILDTTMDAVRGDVTLLVSKCTMFCLLFPILQCIFLIELIIITIETPKFHIQYIVSYPIYKL